MPFFLNPLIPALSAQGRAAHIKLQLHKQDIIDIEDVVRTSFGSDYIQVTKVNGYKTLDDNWVMPQEIEKERQLYPRAI